MACSPPPFRSSPGPSSHFAAVAFVNSRDSIRNSGYAPVRGPKFPGREIPPPQHPFFFSTRDVSLICTASRLRLSWLAGLRSLFACCQSRLPEFCLRDRQERRGDFVKTTRNRRHNSTVEQTLLPVRYRCAPSRVSHFLPLEQQVRSDTRTAS